MMADTFLLVTVVCFTIAFQAVESIVKDDEVFDLPGLSYKPKFRQFSGYLKATGTRRLHYWFVESQGNPAADPLVLWMNGGPACSSLHGFLSGHGPFLVSNDGKTLVENPYAWNKIANIIYLEAPAGVGYSYSTDNNYTTSDDQTSLDNYWALKNFLSSYQEFSQNEFYITGEGYGGIYVPTLAVRIAEDKSFNFKGFAIGNALSDNDMNTDSLVYFAYYHGLISERAWLDLVGSCCSGANSTVGNCQFSQSSSVKCSLSVMGILITIIRNLNLFNLYDECYRSPPSNSIVIHQLQFFLPFNKVVLQKERSYKDGFHELETIASSVLIKTLLGRRSHTWLKTDKILASNLSVTEGLHCFNVTAITNYLNLAAVRKALHIPNDLQKWEICSALNYTSDYSTMKNQYINILSLGKQRMMLYNGDTDMAYNFLGEEWFVNSLPLKVKDPQAYWFYKAKDGTLQVAGFVQTFNNFSFVTIKGAGHMVPQDKPIQAFEMFSNFLSGIF